MSTTTRGDGVGQLPGDLYAWRILDRLARVPDHGVVCHRGLWVCGRDLRRLICGAVDGLARLGVGRDGTVAALTAPNDPLMLVIRYAANMLGARIVYIRAVNPRQEEIGLSLQARVAILRETGAEVLFTDQPSLSQALAVTRSHGDGVRVCGFGLEDGVAAEEVERFTESDDLPGSLARDWDQHATAAVIYTSGTTGAPKGVRMSFGAWESMVRGFARSQSRPPTFLAVTPISQAASSMLDGAIAAGGSAILHPGFDPDAVLGVIADDAVTGIYMAVPHLYQLLDHPRTPEIDRSQLTCLIYSGTPASPRRIEHASRLFGTALIQSYGTTEAGPISVLLPMAHRSPDLRRTVGRPLPGVRVRICDPETGAACGTGVSGEVLVHAPTMMSGYLGEPPISDGWLRTGDLGTVDARGYLSLSGRVGDMIKARGIKIYPAAVAEALMAHPAVTGAHVFGIRGPDEVEEVHAAVALYPGAEVTAVLLRHHVEAELTPLHSPDVITIWTALPLTPTGKPDRMRLMLAEESDTERIIWRERAADRDLAGAGR